eukprot:gene1095-4323_t
MSDFLGGLGKTVNSLKTSAWRSAVRVVNPSKIETCKTEGLDLTFITSRIAAMSGIFTRFSSKSGVNMKSDVVAFCEHHKDKIIRFFNVGEYKYDVIPEFEIEQKFISAGELKSLRRLYRACKAIALYLERNPDSVAIIICEDGLGRSGTVISALMCACRLMSLPDDAINVFCRIRTIGAYSLLSRSQRRYVGYINALVTGHAPHSHELRLDSLHLHGTPPMNANQSGARPYILILVGSQEIYDSRKSTSDRSQPRLVLAGDDIEFSMNVTVLGDVCIQVWHYSTRISKDNSRLICQAQFHTGYIHEEVTSFPSDELDGDGKILEQIGTQILLKCVQGKTHDERLAWAFEPKINTNKQQTFFTSNDEWKAFISDFAMMKGLSKPNQKGLGYFSDDIDDDELMEDAAVAEVPSDVTKFMQQVISENNDLPTSNSTVQFVDTFEAPLLQDNLVSTQPDDTEIDHGEKTNKVHTRDSPVNLLDLDDFVTAGNSDPNTNSRRNNVLSDNMNPVSESNSTIMQTQGNTPGEHSAEISSQISGNLHFADFSCSETGNHSPAVQKEGFEDLLLNLTSAAPPTTLENTDQAIADEFDLLSMFDTQTVAQGLQKEKQKSVAMQAPSTAQTQQQESQRNTAPACRKTTMDAFGEFLDESRFKKRTGPQKLSELVRTSRVKTEDPVLLAVEAWVEGREQNLRSLLVSLPDVLWPDSGWKKFSMADLMEPGRVRQAYKRACLILHPDKHAQSPNTSLAREIFIRISRAYETFLENEQ